MELYNEILLHAVQDVADSLTNWKQTRIILKVHRDLLNSTRQEVRLTQERQRTGLNDQQEILTLQHGLLEQQFALKASEADHFVAAIDLIQALGGGYSNTVDFPRPHLAPEASFLGLEALAPAWTLDNVASPLVPFLSKPNAK